MKFAITLLLTLAMSGATLASTGFALARTHFRLGNEVLLEKHRHLVEGKRVGLITSYSGVDSKGESLISIFANDPKINLVALFGPEHGVDGTAPAGVLVKTYIHPLHKIPVYSLYGDVRKPTRSMLEGIDVLLFDIQDVGARYYTYISTMNYCMIAAKEAGIPFVVLDRPNPLGGVIVEGPVLEESFRSFVGVDVLPMAHGMTIGELARYFNRSINANLTVIPMAGYTDPGIVSIALGKHDIKWTKETEELFKNAYFKRLEQMISMPRKGKQVCPGVKALLSRLDQTPDCFTALLTGNYKTSGFIKLKHFKIDQYFDFGAFADDADDRNDLPPIAMKRFKDITGMAPDTKDIVIIGDTPRDIACGKPYRIKVMAVATGSYSVENLAEKSPEWAVNDLSDTENIMRLLLQ